MKADGGDWSVRAGDLEWDCRATVLHIGECFRKLRDTTDCTPLTRLCARALDHLFLDAPRGYESWHTLLWATGRLALGEHPRQKSWQWKNTGT